MFAGIADEERPEVGTAGGQDQLVRLELFNVRGQGHVGELTVLQYLITIFNIISYNISPNFIVISSTHLTQLMKHADEL